MTATIVDLTCALVKEPRKFSRVSLSAQATVTVDDRIVIGEVENVCLGGVFVKSKEPVAVGSIVSVSINDSGASSALSGLKGKVVRVVEDGMGIQFLDTCG